MEYKKLKGSCWGLYKDEFDTLPMKEGLHSAEGVPDGTKLVIFNKNKGIEEIMYEAIKEQWYEIYC